MKTWEAKESTTDTKMRVSKEANRHEFEVQEGANRHEIEVQEEAYARGDGAGNISDDSFVVAVDASGTVYVAGWESDNVYKITGAVYIL